MKLTKRWCTRAAVILAVVIIGLALPAMAAAKKVRSDESWAQPRDTTVRASSLLHLLDGLEQPYMGEDPASPTLPPGLGGTPPGKPSDRGRPETPPGQGGDPPGRPDDRPPAHSHSRQNRDAD